MAGNDTPIICNGFKDAEFIETAMLAHRRSAGTLFRWSRNTPSWRLILEYAENIGVRPKFGMRVKLAARGGGSVAVVRRLSLEVRADRAEIAQRAGRAEELAAWKIASSCCTFIRGARYPTSGTSRRALNEAAHVYTELVSRARAWNTWMSAAGWESITTARKPTSNRASTTACRNMPTTWCITSRTVLATMRT